MNTTTYGQFVKTPVTKSVKYIYPNVGVRAMIIKFVTKEVTE